MKSFLNTLNNTRRKEGLKKEVNIRIVGVSAIQLTWLAAFRLPTPGQSYQI